VNHNKNKNKNKPIRTQNKNMHQCQARENMQPVKSARKYATNVKGREHATSANKGKMYPFLRTGNWYQAQETCN